MTTTEPARRQPTQTYWERLTDLSKLQDGWLDGQSKAPSTEVLEVAGRIVTALPRSLDPVRVSPTADGGIQLEWDDDHGGHEIEIMPDLHLFLLTVEPGEAHSGAAAKGEARDQQAKVLQRLAKAVDRATNARRDDFALAPSPAGVDDTELREPDNPAATALAQHIADHPMSTIQAAFRILGMTLAVDLHPGGAKDVGRT